MSIQLLRIERRFHGPPDSGNGGYVAGLVARALGGSGCTVTLRQPPPLEVPLTLRSSPDGAELFEGDRSIASAARAELALEIPPPPSLAEARAAQDRYVGHHRHHFPACFVCGPEREDGDGLRIFPGNAAGGQVAASWTPADDLASRDGPVRTEFLWAALDCPGYFAVEESAGLALLGRMTAVIERIPSAGEPLIISGWAISSEGRKHHVGTALHDDQGARLAYARSTWISIA
ncbi:MAG: hypothetical protein ACR2KH_05225 [Sphingomicrobium sp.]